MKIDKIKTYTLRFEDNGIGFDILINGKKYVNGVEIPLDEVMKLARSLSRLAVTCYSEIDKSFK